MERRFLSATLLKADFAINGARQVIELRDSMSLQSYQRQEMSTTVAATGSCRLHFNAEALIYKFPQTNKQRKIQNERFPTRKAPRKRKLTHDFSRKIGADQLIQLHKTGCMKLRRHLNFCRIEHPALEISILHLVVRTLKDAYQGTLTSYSIVPG